MSSAADARRHPRYSVEVEASVQIEGDRLDATTRDIGRGGICLFAPRQIGTGQNLGLSLSLILGSSAFSESLDLTARVIWCTPLGDRFQVGAVFSEMTPAKLGQLDMFLRFLQQEILPNGTEPQDPEEKFDTGDLDEP